MIVAGLVAALFALWAARYILAPVLLGVVFGLMLAPIAGRIERQGISPWISSAFVFLLFISALLSLAYVLSGPIMFWAAQLPRIWAELQIQLSEPLESMNMLRDELRGLTGGEGLTVSVDEGSPVTDIAWLAPAYLGQMLLFVTSLYFFVATRHATRHTAMKLCTNRRLRWRVAHVFRDVEGLVSRYLLSITAINAGLGLAVTIALWAVGVPSPALWGALAGLLNYIMYVGPALMATMLFVVGLGTFDTLTGALMPPLVYLSINLMEAQIVTPMVIGRTLTLNPFAVLLALAFWIWIWGPIGGFVAIPAVLIVIAIARNLIPGAAN
jgi:predicted PurR-regulated permease PerM